MATVSTEAVVEEEQAHARSTAVAALDLPPLPDVAKVVLERQSEKVLEIYERDFGPVPSVTGLGPVFADQLAEAGLESESRSIRDFFVGRKVKAPDAIVAYLPRDLEPAALARRGADRPRDTLLYALIDQSIRVLKTGGLLLFTVPTTGLASKREGIHPLWHLIYSSFGELRITQDGEHAVLTLLAEKQGKRAEHATIEKISSNGQIRRSTATIEQVHQQLVDV